MRCCRRYDQIYPVEQLQDFAAKAQQVAIGINVLRRGDIGAATNALERVRIVIRRVVPEMLLVIDMRLAAHNRTISLSGEGYLLRAAAKLLKYRNNIIDRAPNFFVYVVPEFSRQTQAQSRGALFDRGRIKDGREALTVNVLRIVMGDGLQHERRIGGSVRHGANMVERPRERDDAARAHQAITWLVAGQPTKCGGQADGARRVSADRATAHPCRNGNSRARR